MSNRVLIVCVDRFQLTSYVTALRAVSPTVMPAMTFEGGKMLLLAACADVLVTDHVDGFQLAILARAQMRGVRSIVVGPPDELLEQDLRSIDASYVSSGDMDDVIEAVREAIVRDRPRRRWSRRPPRRKLMLEIDGEPARVLDLSYGGVRVEVRKKPGVATPGTVTLAIPRYKVREQATSLWMRSASRDVYWCGFALDANQTGAGSRWRAFVEDRSAR